jgi:hypothetical protein
MHSGIRNHQQRSEDPRCHEPKEWDDIDRMDESEVDSRGDFFGDYEDYSAEEFGEVEEVGSGENQSLDRDSDVDEGDVDGASLEPERLPNPATSTSMDSIEASGDAMQRPNRLRGGAEVELKNKPYIVKFKKGKAGAVYANHDCIDENTAYTLQVNDPDNPFSPFSSKIEWEIAHWAKTRGPNSTAFQELLSIKGVCGIITLSEPELELTQWAT